MQSTKIRWKKNSGTLTLRDGRTIKAGGIFRASIDEIPKAFRDTVIPLDDIQEKPNGDKNSGNFDNERNQEDRYIMEEKSRGWYKVLDTETGDYVNEKSLREDEARALIEEKLRQNTIKEES